MGRGFLLGWLVLLASHAQQVHLSKHHARHQRILTTQVMVLLVLPIRVHGYAMLATTTSTEVCVQRVPSTPGALQGR